MTTTMRMSVNGNLVITAREENFGGSNYTSARMVTRNKFSQTYGKWEARIDLPTGQGIWPAFWMLRENNPWPGEIDIMEMVGHLPGNCHGTAHWGEVGNVQSPWGRHHRPDWTTDFHVYTVEWWPDHIRWSVDGQVYFELDRTQVTPANPWLFAEDYHMLLNVAVGGTWPGSPDATTVFPQEMRVDWVRVYEHVPEPQPVTFRVDLSQESLGTGDQVYVTGSFDDWAGSQHALQSQGNGIWSTTLDCPKASTNTSSRSTGGAAARNGSRPATRARSRATATTTPTSTAMSTSDGRASRRMPTASRPRRVVRALAARVHGP